MKKYKQSILYSSAIALVTMSQHASAALDLTGVTMDITPVETIMGTIITGLAAMWGFRKVIKTINRS